MKVKFAQSDHTFTAKFESINDVSDGGYERGYEAGYEKGNTEGYAAGVKEGYDDGCVDGVDMVVNNTLISYTNKTTTTMRAHTFRGSTALEYADFHILERIPVSTFGGCTNLKTLIIRTSTPCILENPNAFSGTPLDKGTGFLYVPSALVDSYKVAKNWSTYAAQIRAIEDYPDICGHI